jgi:hypothetical protein
MERSIKEYARARHITGEKEDFEAEAMQLENICKKIFQREHSLKVSLPYIYGTRNQHYINSVLLENTVMVFLLIKQDGMFTGLS